MNVFPSRLWRLGPLVVTDTMLVTVLLSLAILLGARLALRFPGSRALLELGFDALERSILEVTGPEARALVPLVLTLWVFLGLANLVSLLPGVSSPTRDLSLTAALAFLSLSAGHVHGLRVQGLRYLRHYVEPSPLLLPFNVIGEVGRTIALALRLFGNMLSGHLVIAIILYLAGLLIPLPLMLLGILTGVVQAYIFGILTLVFAASSVHQAQTTTKTKDA